MRIKINADRAIAGPAFDPLRAHDGGAAEILANVMGGAAAPLLPDLVNQIALGIGFLHRELVELVLVAGRGRAPARFAAFAASAPRFSGGLFRTFAAHGRKCIGRKQRSWTGGTACATCDHSIGFN